MLEVIGGWYLIFFLILIKKNIYWLVFVYVNIVMIYVDKNILYVDIFDWIIYFIFFFVLKESWSFDYLLKKLILLVKKLKIK